MSSSDEIDKVPTGDARTQLRSSMFLAAVLRSGAQQSPVKVRNMSPNGAMIETTLVLPRGATVHLLRGPLIASGVVIWSSSSHCGVKFAGQVSVKEWLAAPAAVHQQRVDEMIALVRAGVASGAAEPLSGINNTQRAEARPQLVEDLGSVIRLMQALEDELASSMDTLERHGPKLQNLDIAVQMLRAVASELVPGNDEGTSLAKLQDLRVACAKALGTE